MVDQKQSRNHALQMVIANLLLELSQTHKLAWMIAEQCETQHNRCRLCRVKGSLFQFVDHHQNQ